MGKVDYFSIVLDRPNPIYFSGELITGKVNFRVKERFKINGVNLEADGEAYVHW